MVSRVYLFLVGWVWLMLPLILPLDANHIPSSPIKSHQIPSKPVKNPTIYSLSFPHLIPSILPLTQAEVHKVEDQLGPTPRKTLRRPGEARSFPAIKRGFLMAFHQPKIWWPRGMVILISWDFFHQELVQNDGAEAPGCTGPRKPWFLSLLQQRSLAGINRPHGYEWNHWINHRQSGFNDQ